MQTVKIDKNQAGQRLDKFLRKYLPNAESSFLYKMLRKKNITLNGKKAEGKELLIIGDEVTCFFSEETFLKFSGKENFTMEYQNAYHSLKKVEVLYEDENVIALNKPAGILTQKAKEEDLSLNEWLIGYLLEQGEITQEELITFRPSVCNRLDRNTSGIVLCGKSLAGSQILSSMIKERFLRKFYRTICVGEVKEGKRIDGYLVKNHKTNKVSVVKEITPENKEEASRISTAYQPIKYDHGFTLLEVELITGKAHQIRAHLSSIGHPIIGDGKYGDMKTNQKIEKKFGLHHQLLHAYRVEFPQCEGALAKLSLSEIVASFPKDFDDIVKTLQL